jgi:hypothetical protein
MSTELQRLFEQLLLPERISGLVRRSIDEKKEGALEFFRFVLSECWNPWTGGSWELLDFVLHIELREHRSNREGKQDDRFLERLVQAAEQSRAAARTRLSEYCRQLRNRRVGRSRVQQLKSLTASFASDLGIRIWDKRTSLGRRNRRKIAKRFRLLRLCGVENL